MEVDNEGSSPAEDTRRSGRATRRPDVFSQSTHSSGGKRKRGDAHDPDRSDDDVSESETEDGSDEEADEEELRERRRAARKAGTKKSASKNRSRASKKPKVAGNGVGKQLAFRPANIGRLPTARPRKPKVRPSLAAGERGLFGKSLPFNALSRRLTRSSRCLRKE